MTFGAVVPGIPGRAACGTRLLVGLALGCVAVLSWWPVSCAFAVIPVRSKASLVTPLTLRSAEEADGVSSLGESIGHCRGNGDWTVLKSIPIESLMEEECAHKAWEVFRRSYPGPSEKGMFLDTPVAEQDIKYRWRRLKKTLRMNCAECLQLVEKEAVPLVVDSDYVEQTFDAMVRGSSYARALEVVQRNPNVLTAGTGIEGSMDAAEVGALFMEATRPLNKAIQTVLGSGR
mmetsp:Transcript_63872/g.139060  ORF Transcript_63872/g.139060 Transcript_63872/m.139060 type:complete len:232 (+) Transcript_63872:78-773(+)